MHQFHFDSQRCRIVQRLAGFLTVAEAEAVRDEVAAACERACVLPGTLTMVADLRDYPPQSREVSRVGEEIARILARATPAVFAVVTGSALQRVRLRRVMEAARPQFFGTVEDAAAALGWEPSWTAASLSSPDTPPAAALPRAAGH